MVRWYYYDYYKPSRPREAKGGIKAQSKRGAFGESWWAKRWITVLESFDIGARLGRGRSYARLGQVLSIQIGKGVVSAEVQGSRPNPYEVKIKVKAISNADWNKLTGRLSTQAIFAAKLLAGEMPRDIENVFEDADFSLFPEKLSDLQTNCSCPDWSNPCKHIAAVYYLLGEEFDRDPFLIFKLRGMDREELISRIAGKTKSKTGAGLKKTSTSWPGREQAQPEQLPAEPEKFWGQVASHEDAADQVSIPPVTAALPRRLGKFPFWRGKENFISALEGIYRQASSVGMDIFLGGQGVTREARED